MVPLIRDMIYTSRILYGQFFCLPKLPKLRELRTHLRTFSYQMAQTFSHVVRRGLCHLPEILAGSVVMQCRVLYAAASEIRPTV
jgi:hypothetical protein